MMRNFWTCVFSNRDSRSPSDAKAGGTAPNIAKITKHKMQTDEALKILGFEGRKSLNPLVLTEVRSKYSTIMAAILRRLFAYSALFDHPKEYLKYDKHDKYLSHNLLNFRNTRNFSKQMAWKADPSTCSPRSIERKKPLTQSFQKRLKKTRKSQMIPEKPSNGIDNVNR